MDSIDCYTCYKAFNDLCGELSNSELLSIEELQYWVFERGYKVALEAAANVQKVDTKFLDAVWSTQPSLEQDFALH